MADPSLALEDAIIARLRADIPAVSGRVFDLVAQDTAFPHIEVGQFQTIDDSAGCIDGVEVFATLHVWSRDPGHGEAKQIASAVHGSLHNGDLDLGPGWHFMLIEHHTTLVRTDPDGKTAHAVITFRALIDAR